jgi:diguanylate cyclase (GGDEF)-like protein
MINAPKIIGHLLSMIQLNNSLFLYTTNLSQLIKKLMKKTLFRIRYTSDQQKIIIILLAIFVFFLIGLGLAIPLQPAGLPLTDWQIESNGVQSKWTAPAFQMIQLGITNLTLHTTFPGTKADILVIPHISGNTISVILNQKPIYQLGDFTTPTSNLWNSVLFIQLPEPLQAQNTLEIHIASTFSGAGLNAIPYLANFSEDAPHILWLNWVYGDFLLIASGMALITGLILIIFCFLRRKLWSAEFYISLALLFSVIFNQDMLFRLTSGDINTFLWTKKIILISGYLATLCFLLGLEKYIVPRFKISNGLIGLTALAAVSTLLSPDLYALTIVSQFTSIITALNVLALVILILSQPQKPVWLLFPATLFILSILQMILYIPLNLSWPLEAPYLIALTTLLFGVNLVLEFNQMFNENIQLQVTNNLDPLTGVMNRRILDNLNTSQYNFVILVDLDRFKELNDTQGHMFGDQVLIEFTRITRSRLRQRDMIIRWGGDEFLLALSDIPKTINGFHLVESIIERIAVQYGLFHKELNLTFSYGITIVDNSFEKSLEDADNRMYHMKQARRAQNTLPVA